MTEQQDGKCTIDGCDQEATQILQWPEPGGLKAAFCDEHTSQKLAITKVERVDE